MFISLHSLFIIQCTILLTYIGLWTFWFEQGSSKWYSGCHWKLLFRGGRIGRRRGGGRGGGRSSDQEKSEENNAATVDWWWSKRNQRVLQRFPEIGYHPQINVHRSNEAEKQGQQGGDTLKRESFNYKENFKYESFQKIS